MKPNNQKPCKVSRVIHNDNKKPKERNAFCVEVGWRLRVIRQKSRMSMRELGEKMGLSYGQINKYERGFDRINIERLHELAEIFDVSAGYFLGEAEQNYSPYYMNRLMTIAAEIENTPSDEVRNALYRLIKMTNKAFHLKDEDNQ